MCGVGGGSRSHGKISSEGGLFKKTPLVRPGERKIEVTPPSYLSVSTRVGGEPEVFIFSPCFVFIPNFFGWGGMALGLIK